MKLLLDSCVWGGALAGLRAEGFDTVWAGEWERDPGDSEILARALAEGRVLVTLDKDFGHLAIALGLPHPAIIRLVGIGARQQAACVIHLLRTHADEIAQAALFTVEPGRLRIRLHTPAKPAEEK